MKNAHSAVEAHGRALGRLFSGVGAPTSSKRGLIFDPGKELAGLKGRTVNVAVCHLEQFTQGRGGTAV